ncbi:MAG: DUF4234 domain-containing protein [Clostridia bacterium]|nr:DUF4234 domain-containing protein [Clostridia bacterium]
MYCKNCGKELAEGSAFCTNCGAPCDGQPRAEAATPNRETIAALTIMPRSIGKAIFFAIITCGIYSIYWFVQLTNEMNRLTGNEKDTSGGMAWFLGVVTCGIYSYYWAYKMGGKRDKLDATSGGSSSVIYLVLMIFGLGIVAYALMQDGINKALRK